MMAVSRYQIRAIIVLALLVVSIVSGSFLARFNSLSNPASRHDSHPNMLPKLPPNDDSLFLLEFHTDTSENDIVMKPLVARLERDIGTKVRRINVDRTRDALAILDAVGHYEGGSFPFYYNRKTGQAVNGATTYDNLLKWATGGYGLEFNCPTLEALKTDSVSMGNEGGEGAYTGYFGILYDKWMDRTQQSEKDSQRNKAKRSWKLPFF